MTRNRTEIRFSISILQSKIELGAASCLIDTGIDCDMREGNLDTESIEALLQTTLELATDPPLLYRSGFGAGTNNDGRISELLETHDFERF